MIRNKNQNKTSRQESDTHITITIDPVEFDAMRIIYKKDNLYRVGNESLILSRAKNEATAKTLWRSNNCDIRRFNREKRPMRRFYCHVIVIS